MKKNRLSIEWIMALLILLLCAVISIINPTFLTFANLLDMVRSCVVSGIFAIGILMVIISGGMDISFPAIAAFSMYATVKLFNAVSYTGTFLLPLLVSAAMGFALGSVNALLVHRFRLPTLIASIGTSNLFNGILLTFLGSAAIMKLPKGYTAFAKTNLITASAEYGLSSVPIAFLVLVALALFAAYILRFTMLGRGIYAIGGNKTSAERIGFNIGAIQLFIYGFMGATAGIAGTINTAIKRTCNPFDVIGIELTIIAAVVLGGAKITGGKGSVAGTLLGVFMFTIINNSLIMIGVSTYWQRTTIGLLILLSTSIAALQEKRSKARALGV